MFCERKDSLISNNNQGPFSALYNDDKKRENTTKRKEREAGMRELESIHVEGAIVIIILK